MGDREAATQKNSSKLEIDCQAAYHLVMDTTKRHAPAGWLESLEISEAELAAGKTVPAEPIFRRLQESIEQLEKAQAPTPRRRRSSSASSLKQRTFPT
jgi:hypothetical protein